MRPATRSSSCALSHDVTTRLQSPPSPLFSSGAAVTAAHGNNTSIARSTANPIRVRIPP